MSTKINAFILSEAIHWLTVKIQLNSLGIASFEEYRQARTRPAGQLPDLLRGFAGVLDSVRGPEDPIAVSLVQYAVYEAERVEEFGIYEDEPVLGLLDALYAAVEERITSTPLLSN